MATVLIQLTTKRERIIKTDVSMAIPGHLGWDIAGIVASTGDDVTSFKVGDPVLLGQY